MKKLIFAVVVLIFLAGTARAGACPPGPPTSKYPGTVAGVPVSGGGLQFTYTYAYINGFACFERLSSWFPSYISGAIDMAYAQQGTATFSNVTVPTAGSYTMTVHYAFAEGLFPGITVRPEGIAVNGTPVTYDMNFPETGSFSGYADESILIQLNAGTNTIQMFNVSGDGVSRVQTMTITPGGAANTCTTVATAPTGLSAAGISGQEVDLAWTASTWPSGCSQGYYDVYRSTTPGFTPSSSNLVGGGAGAPGQKMTFQDIASDDNQLVCNTTYYYVMEAVDFAGFSGPSNQATATSGACPTQGPASVNAGGPAVSPFIADNDYSGGSVNSTAASIDLTGATNPAPMAVYQTSRNGNGVTYTFAGFTAGSSNLVRLHFAETYFSGSGSRVFNVTINGTQVLTNFDVYKAAGAKNKAVVKEFTENADSTGTYTIQFNAVTNTPIVSGLEVLSTGTSCGGVPSAPGGLAATTISSSQINLSWTASTAPSGCTVSGYDVFRSTTSGFTPSSSNQVATNVSGTSFSDTGLAASTTYYYKVEAVDSAGVSTPSSQASATTSASGCSAAPSAPSGLTATAASSSQVNLSWTASTVPSGCTLSGYNVFRSTTSGFTPSGANQIASGVSSASYSDTTASCGTAYFYLAEAVDGFGSSGASNQASATTSACSTTSVQINAGGPAVSPFVADVDFSGGATINHANTIDLSGVTNPAPAAVYQTARVNTFSYTIPATSGSSHTIRLHFCETYFSSAGSRVFNVSINGTQVLTNFDVFVAAGNAKNKAVIEQFTETANSSGYVIQFTTVTNSAMVSGIEVQ